MAGWSDENDMDDLLDEIDEDLSRKKTKVRKGAADDINIY